MSELKYRVPKWWPYQEQFPQWRVWFGYNKRYYARLPDTDPLVVVHGSTPEALREQITRHASRPS